VGCADLRAACETCSLGDEGVEGTGSSRGDCGVGSAGTGKGLVVGVRASGGLSAGLMSTAPCVADFACVVWRKIGFGPNIRLGTGGRTLVLTSSVADSITRSEPRGEERSTHVRASVYAGVGRAPQCKHSSAPTVVLVCARRVLYDIFWSTV